MVFCGFVNMYAELRSHPFAMAKLPLVWYHSSPQVYFWSLILFNKMKVDVAFISVNSLAIIARMKILS